MLDMIVFFPISTQFLANQTAACSMIGSWHDAVICLSVTICIVSIRVGVGGQKL